MIPDALGAHREPSALFIYTNGGDISRLNLGCDRGGGVKTGVLMPRTASQLPLHWICVDKDNISTMPFASFLLVFLILSIKIF